MTPETPENPDYQKSTIEEIAKFLINEQHEWNREKVATVLRQCLPADASPGLIDWCADRVKHVMAEKQKAADALEQVAEHFQESIAVRSDLEFLQQTERWPYDGTIINLAHRTETDESGIARLGVIWAQHPFKVLQISQFDLPMLGGSMTMEEAFATAIDYESHEALLEDWKID